MSYSLNCFIYKRKNKHTKKFNTFQYIIKENEKGKLSCKILNSKTLFIVSKTCKRLTVTICPGRRSHYMLRSLTSGDLLNRSARQLLLPDICDA